MSWNPQQPSQHPYGPPQQPQQPYGTSQQSYQQPAQQPYNTSGQPPRQNAHQITINGHGLFGLVATAIMIGVAFILHWNIIWWYFVLAIFAYSTVIIYLTYYEESVKKQSERRAGEDEERWAWTEAERERVRFNIFRWLLGCHIASYSWQEACGSTSEPFLCKWAFLSQQQLQD